MDRLAAYCGNPGTSQGQPESSLHVMLPPSTATSSSSSRIGVNPASVPNTSVQGSRAYTSTPATHSSSADSVLQHPLYPMLKTIMDELRKLGDDVKKLHDEQNRLSSTLKSMSTASFTIETSPFKVRLCISSVHSCIGLHRFLVGRALHTTSHIVLQRSSSTAIKSGNICK